MTGIVRRLKILGFACFALTLVTVSLAFAISSNVHTFYYPWYANPSTDGYWFHWDGSDHSPPDDVSAAFYPQLGAYSSNNLLTVHQHMKWIRDAGIGVVVTSWWGQGTFEDNAVNLLMDIANLYGLKVCFHIEPYGGRTGASTKNDVIFIINTYGSKPAFFRDSGMGNRPVFYVFASNDIPDSQWAPAWDSIRGTQYDSVVIGDTLDHNRALNGHWDGFYNYWPNIDSTNWASHANWARNNNKIFVPPVGPGWDVRQSRYDPTYQPRNDGQWYDSVWQTAYNVAKTNTSMRYIGITSFNEWHEGTQIEPVVPKTIPSRTYYDYSPDIPTCYLDKTASWAATFDPTNGGKIQCEDYSGGASATEGVDYHDTTAGNSGGAYRSHGVDIQACDEGGYNVGWVAAGEWLRYTNVQVAETGDHEIRLRGSAWNAPGIVRVCQGSLSNTVATLTIPVTGGFQKWRTVSQVVPLTAGSHTIYLVVDTGDINLNWFEVRPAVDFLPPAAPNIPGAANLSVTSVRWTWQDNSSNETGFKVWADPGYASPVTLRATAAANATFWDYTNLTGNTRYCFQVAATNAGGDSNKTSNYITNTLANPPTIGENITCNKSVGVAYPAGSSFVFSNPVSFGIGSHGGSQYKVSKYTYVWDQSPTHVWSGSEATWSSGTINRLPSGSGSYYLHIRAWNYNSVPVLQTLDYGPFVYDETPPSTTAGPAGGVCNTSKTVTLTCSESATVYYTTDGSEPTSGSSVYSSPIAVSFNTTLRFFAVDAVGNAESPKKQEVYIILAEDGSIASAKQEDDGMPVALGAKELYLKWSDFGYIEEPKRFSGLRVEGAITADEGQSVCLTGTMRKPVGAEPYILVDTMTSVGPGSVGPLGASNRALKNSLMDGLYTTVWGLVKPGSVIGNSYVLSDGSDASGVQIMTKGAPGVDDGQFVIVSGAVGVMGGSRVLYVK